jgi:hypothetical protein
MVEGVGKGIRSIWRSSPSCLKRVGVRVGEAVVVMAVEEEWGTGEPALTGVLLREPRTSAES